MSSKSSSKNKAPKSEKKTHRWTVAQIAFVIFAVLLILTMVLSLIIQNY